MEQFNKALSFILGLIVVAVFIVVASGKFNIKGFSLSKTKTAGSTTPTVTPQTTPKPTSKPWFFAAKPTTKPTPTKSPAKLSIKPTVTPIVYTFTNTKGGVQQQKKQTDPNYHSYNGSSVPTSIPNTGIPVVMFPLFGTSLLTGIFMRKTGKKD